jgi:hypothetical protein
MKKQMIVSIVASLLFSSVLTVASVNAQTKMPGTPQKTWVKYEGEKDGTMLFDMSYYNPGGKKISVAIYDDTHNKLFEGFYTDKDFYKKFQIDAGLTNKLLFVVRSAKEDLAQSFKVDMYSQTDVAVTKL